MKLITPPPLDEFEPPADVATEALASGLDRDVKAALELAFGRALVMPLLSASASLARFPVFASSPVESSPASFRNFSVATMTGVAAAMLAAKDIGSPNCWVPLNPPAFP